MKFEFDLNLLPVLETLVNEQSVTRAAEKLEMTQSAISHALKRLREHFNDPLLVRSGNRMLPTPRLIGLSPFIASTMRALRDELGSSTGFDPVHTAYTFTINTTDVGQVTMAPIIISELKRLAPHCSLRVLSLSPRDVSAALEAGDIDLSLGLQRPTADGFIQQVVEREQLVTVTGRDFPRDPLDFTDHRRFELLPHIAVNPFGVDRDVFESLFLNEGLRRNFACTLSSFLAAMVLVETTEFVATLPDLLVRALGRNFRLDLQASPLTVSQRSICQVWHRRCQTDPANVWMRRTIAAVFSQRRKSQAEDLAEATVRIH